MSESEEVKVVSVEKGVIIDRDVKMCNVGAGSISVGAESELINNEDNIRITRTLTAKPENEEVLEGIVVVKKTIPKKKPKAKKKLIGCCAKYNK